MVQEWPTITGECSRCGDCCAPPVIVDNPIILRGETRCRFYIVLERPTKFGHCLIMGRGATPIEQVRDAEGRQITKEQVDWYEANCPDYPEKETSKLIPECSYTIEGSGG